MAAADYNLYADREFLPVAFAPGAEEGAAAGGQNREFDNTADSSDATVESSSAKKTRVRSEFPETWLWSDYVTE